MSRFFSQKYSQLIPYTPGEQPKDNKYIKLNTNESPFKPSKKAIKLAKTQAKRLNLYPDPTCSILIREMAKTFCVKENQIILGNGSDEILNYIFLAYCDNNKGAVFADITYGFYSVQADLLGVKYKKIPLKEDFSICVEDYFNAGNVIFIANPNAPTGINLSLSDVEKVLINNKDDIVVIDEAYVDFGGDSAIKLIDKYQNLIVVQTFSKSRSMAGARLGMAFANENLIQDLNSIKYCINPYNVNKMTMCAGVGVMRDQRYTLLNCKKIISAREWTVCELSKLGFTCLPSKTNFIFAKHCKLGGEFIYKKLKENNILVRYFSSERIKDFNRITIGTKKQMEVFVDTIKQIVKE